MKKQTTKKNIANWHARKLRIRTQRRAKAFAAHLEKLEKAKKKISAATQKRNENIENQYQDGLRKDKEVGPNPIYLSSSAFHKAYPEFDRQERSAAYRMYEKKLSNFKEKLRKEDLENYKKSHPEAQNVLQRAT